ncbi:MAG: DUF1320 family protein [Bacteroidales bacterium]|nr:DUF1320 family protein [Bacteroidales bacterium]
MIFLKHDDFSVTIDDNLLNQIIKNQPALLDSIELMAIAEMQSYIASRFDVANIFSKQGNQRNQLIVLYLIDMILYHLHARVSPRNISQLRVDRYNQAIEWLKMASTGIIQPDLPLKADTQGNADDRLKWGSNTKLNQRY